MTPAQAGAPIVGGMELQELQELEELQELKLK